MNNKAEIQAAWSKAVNDKENKPYRSEKYGTKYKGKINAKHFVLYNILRGLPLDRGFKPDSQILTVAIWSIEMMIKFDNRYDIKLAFGNTVDADEFREKADEAIRLYRGS